jgi:hypothetical protein
LRLAHSHQAFIVQAGEPAKQKKLRRFRRRR